MENFSLLKEVEEKNLQIQKDLEFASRIHRTLIPESVKTEKADVAVSYLPMLSVGGDYAKFHFLEKDRLVFIICDVTGHGVGAALMVNRIHAEFERLAKEEKSPGMLLKKLDRFIHEDFTGTGMYLSAFCGMLDFKHRQFSYSNYGHPPQYFYQTSDGKIFSLEPQTVLLGVQWEEDVSYEHAIGFQRGDRLLLFTDGILETTSKVGEPYGSQRVEQFLRQNAFLPADDFNAELIEDLKRYNGGTLRDDLFLLTIQIH
jgi:sigma-B regulation protein RsbU (phosphoserine phosphatase)